MLLSDGTAVGNNTRSCLIVVARSTCNTFKCCLDIDPLAEVVRRILDPRQLQLVPQRCFEIPVSAGGKHVRPAPDQHLFVHPLQEIFVHLKSNKSVYYI